MIYLLINHKILSYIYRYYKIINFATIKKTKQISEKLSQYRYWLSFFFILAEFMILYCKDSLGCIDNNNIELINNCVYWWLHWFGVPAVGKLTHLCIADIYLLCM